MTYQRKEAMAAAREKLKGFNVVFLFFFSFLFFYFFPFYPLSPRSRNGIFFPLTYYLSFRSLLKDKSLFLGPGRLAPTSEMRARFCFGQIKQSFSHNVLLHVHFSPL